MACGSFPQPYTYTQNQTADLYAEYALASYANKINDIQNSAVHYHKAYERSQTLALDTDLGRRALLAYVRTGDMAQVYKLADHMLRQDRPDVFAQIVVRIQAFDKGQYDKVLASPDVQTEQFGLQYILYALTGWSAAALGDYETAQMSFEKISKGTYFDILSKLQLAKLAAYREDFETAQTTFKQIGKHKLFMIEGILSQIRAYEQAGETEASKAVLSRALKAYDTSADTMVLLEYQNRLKAGTLQIPLSARSELARALTEVAYGFFSRSQGYDSAEIFLRFAIHLNPEYGKARVWLSDLLEKEGRQAEAITLLKNLPPKSDYYTVAMLNLTNIYFEQDRSSKALETLQTLNRHRSSVFAREALARAQIVLENYQQAISIYTALIDDLSIEEQKRYPDIYFYRGQGYEQTGQWALAEADFKRVLEFMPDHAIVLNYLGYTWIERGEHFHEALKMIEKALESRPKSGAITDSLGWAHYKLGNMDKARLYLEKAVWLSPSSGVIIDHLGDVYWMLGRYREAGYQWQKALQFDDLSELARKKVEQKLKDGLRPDSGMN